MCLQQTRAISFWTPNFQPPLALSNDTWSILPLASRKPTTGYIPSMRTEPSEEQKRKRCPNDFVLTRGRGGEIEPVNLIVASEGFNPPVLRSPERVF